MKTLPYYGGKNAASKHSRVGRWIAARLPIREGYAEPFAGLCGVLLQRRRALNEIISDRDARIVNWWRCVRDRAADFERLVLSTPRSEHEFHRALRVLEARSLADPSDPDGEPNLEIGLATHIVLSDSIMHGLGKPHYARVFSKRFSRSVPDIAALGERMRKVQLLACDASVILERLAGVENTVIYADPPYRTADRTNYGEQDVDWDRLADLLRAQAGFVAVSGHRGDWDCLDWPSVELPAIFTGGGHSAGTTAPRVEVVWSNAPLRSLFDA